MRNNTTIFITESYMEKDQIYKKVMMKAYAKGWGRKDLSLKWFKQKREYLTISFAKAFWGSDKIEIDFKVLPVWKFHLRNMVVLREPTNYLSRFIN